jgi:hypothetical protein
VQLQVFFLDFLFGQSSPGFWGGRAEMAESSSSCVTVRPLDVLFVLGFERGLRDQRNNAGERFQTVLGCALYSGLAVFTSTLKLRLGIESGKLPNRSRSLRPIGSGQRFCAGNNWS